MRNGVASNEKVQNKKIYSDLLTEIFNSNSRGLSLAIEVSHKFEL